MEEGDLRSRRREDSAWWVWQVRYLKKDKLVCTAQKQLPHSAQMEG